MTVISALTKTLGIRDHQRLTRIYNIRVRPDERTISLVYFTPPRAVAVNTRRYRDQIVAGADGIMSGYLAVIRPELSDRYRFDGGFRALCQPLELHKPIFAQLDGVVNIAGLTAALLVLKAPNRHRNVKVATACDNETRWTARPLPALDRIDGGFRVGYVGILAISRVIVAWEKRFKRKTAQAMRTDNGDFAELRGFDVVVTVFRYDPERGRIDGKAKALLPAVKREPELE